MELEELICPACGSNELENSSEEEFFCHSCGRTFREKNKCVDIEKAILLSLDAQKLNLYSNAKVNLWKETHQEFLSDESIDYWVNEVKKYSPDDFFANFYNLATFYGPETINNYIRDYLENGNFEFADEVLRYLIKTVDNSSTIQWIHALLNSANLPHKLFHQYEEEIANLSEKLDNGVFNTHIPRDVFIAYSSKDIIYVSELIDFLESNEIKCFCAQRNLRHGKGAKENYEKELINAMNNSKCVVFVSTVNSRSMDCDALKKELPYYRDVATKKGRIEFVQDTTVYGNTVKGVKEFLKSVFRGLEYCTDKVDLIERLIPYISGGLEDEEESINYNKTSVYEEQLKETAKLVEQLKSQTVTTVGDFKISADNTLVKYIGKNPDVIVPNNVKEIGTNAFSNCTFLKSIILPKGLKAIGDGAFFKCTSLKNINIPDGVKTISYNAFRSCTALEDITFTNAIEEIGDGAFCDCENLINVLTKGSGSTLPNKLKKINESVFTNCSSLSDIEIPASVTKILPDAFAGCDNLFVRFAEEYGWIAYSEKKYSMLDEKDFEDNCAVEKYGSFTLINNKEIYENLVVIKNNKMKIINGFVDKYMIIDTKINESFKYFQDNSLVNNRHRKKNVSGSIDEVVQNFINTYSEYKNKLDALNEYQFSDEKVNFSVDGEKMIFDDTTYDADDIPNLEFSAFDTDEKYKTLVQAAYTKGSDVLDLIAYIINYYKSEEFEALLDKKLIDLNKALKEEIKRIITTL